MKIYKISTNIQFIRGENAETLTQATGEAGIGYYFSPITNIKMAEYYTKDSKHVWLASSKDNCNIIDLTFNEHIEGIISMIKENTERMKRDYEHYIVPNVNRSNYQRFPYSVEQYINEKFSNVDAYLISHNAVGIPSGKQLVIRNLEAFELEQIR